MLFLLRGHQQDSEGGFEPGSTLVVATPIRLVGEVLLHVERFAAALSPPPTEAVVRWRWEGLANRTLGSWPSRWYDLRPYRGRQDCVESEISLPAGGIAVALPELVARTTQPLYEAFDFFAPAVRMIPMEIAELRGRWV
jgi:hypothetical protein